MLLTDLLIDSNDVLFITMEQLTVYGTRRSVYITLGQFPLVCTAFKAVLDALPAARPSLNALIHGGDPLAKWIVKRPEWIEADNHYKSSGHGPACVPSMLGFMRYVHATLLVHVAC